jgi:hypothetical protein
MEKILDYILASSIIFENIIKNVVKRELFSNFELNLNTMRKLYNILSCSSCAVFSSQLKPLLILLFLKNIKIRY